MYKINIFLMLCTSFVLTNSDMLLDSEWKTFKKRFNKDYKPYEDILRKNNYFRNKDRISTHNFLYDQGIYHFKLGINQFADWTEQEFYLIFQSSNAGSYQNSTNRWIGRADPSRSRRQTNHSRPKRQHRLFKDWRLERGVNPVRDQTVMGKSLCNAGWAFAAVAAIEGHDSKFPTGLQQYSEQNLIDCVANDMGCSGLSPRFAFHYVIRNRNINLAYWYPYTGNSKRCAYNENVFGTTGIEVKLVNPNSEDDMLEAVAEDGPLVIGFDPIQFTFMFYASGPYDDHRCNQRTSNQLHYMTIIGFDKTPGKNYWIVRNSFGATWGEQGYMMVPRNVNQCGISLQPSFLVI